MEKSSFFNSVNGDRKYKANEFAEYFASFIGNGVFPNPATNLQLVSNNDMTVTLRRGSAWINGYFYVNTDNLILRLDVADGVLSRIDRVVLRLDFLTREIRATIKKGQLASSPVAINLQRDADAYEIALADIRVSRGAISITQADITDLRLNKELCGIVHGTVDQVDTTAIFNQFQSWYSQTKDNYDRDVANWTLQKKNDFERWTDDKRNEYIKWTDAKKADYDKWTYEKKQAFDTWYAANTQAFLNTWNNWYNTNTAQWTNDFKTWFNTIKGQLDGNAVGNLTMKVAEHEEKIKDLDKRVYSAEVNSKSYIDNKINTVNLQVTENVQKTQNAQNTADSALKKANEAFQFADNGKKGWVDVVGSPLLTTDTFTTLKDKTQELKNILASYLSSKGQNSLGTEELQNLINKVANINTGKKWAGGISYKNSNFYYSFSVQGLSFKPKYIIFNVDKNRSGFYFNSKYFYIEFDTQLYMNYGRRILDNGFELNVNNASSFDIEWIAFE